MCRRAAQLLMADGLRVQPAEDAVAAHTAVAQVAAARAKAKAEAAAKAAAKAKAPCEQQVHDACMPPLTKHWLLCTACAGFMQWCWPV
jgi:hypothetical protein